MLSSVPSLLLHTSLLVNHQSFPNPRSCTHPMKPYDLSQPLNQDVFFWPYYPPFEVKYIKRKA